MRRSGAIAAFVLLASSLSAQFPIGHATPIGPFTPSLGAEPLWLGNTGFGYAIKNAPPGGSAFVAVSAERVDQVISGLQIYVDVGNILISHVGPVDVTGQAFLPVPLGGPDIPELAGIQAYAQAAVDDPASPGSFGTTQGLLLEVTLHPMWAYAATWYDLWLVDALTASASSVTGFPAGTAIGDVTFANGGRDLFVSTNVGLFVVDTLAATPAAVALGIGGPIGSHAWDRVHRRLYAISPYDGILYVVDSDRGSPAFGTVITQVSLPLPSPVHLATSADGSVLALVQGSGQLERRIGDPTSPAYLQVIPTPPLSITLNFGVVERPDVSPDGRIISIPVFAVFPTSEIHRFDAVTGQWIDYDATVPGYQPLRISASHPGVPAVFKMLPFRDGSAMILSGNPVVRLDTDLADPANVVTTPTAVAPVAVPSYYLAPSPSGRFLVRREFNLFGGTQPQMISLVEVATGSVTPWVTLPFDGVVSSPPNAWR